MSLRKLPGGSVLAALAAVIVTAALPADASARPADEQRNAMEIRGERVQQANAERQQQRAQQAEQRSQQRTQQVARQSEPRAPQVARPSEPRAAPAERQIDRAAWQAARQSNGQARRQSDRRSEQAAGQSVQRGDQAAGQVQQRNGQARQGERNRSYTDQARNRGYFARNGEARGNSNSRDGRGDDDRNRDWQSNRRDNDRNSTRQDNGRGNDRDNNNWQSGRRDNDWSNRSWDRRWRDNNRYDWQRYRNTNRTAFHVGTYYAPYRYYSYRRYGVGHTLGSLFYGNSYWITNPWQYRLPDVWGPYRWVRYYDDVMLVDIYTGQVVDVIHNFFW